MQQKKVLLQKTGISILCALFKTIATHTIRIICIYRKITNKCLCRTLREKFTTTTAVIMQKYNNRSLARRHATLQGNVKQHHFYRSIHGQV